MKPWRCLQAEAQANNFTPEELENYPALELRFMDNPDALFQHIKQRFKDIGPDKTPVRWVRDWIGTN